MTFDAGGAPRQARVVCRRSQPPSQFDEVPWAGELLGRGSHRGGGSADAGAEGACGGLEAVHGRLSLGCALRSCRGIVALAYSSGGLNALDLAVACRDYAGPNSLETMRRQKEAKAHQEALQFFQHCKVQNVDTTFLVGPSILQALLANRKRGDGHGVGMLSAGTAAVPKKVAQWMRQEGCHPVIWHTTHEKYKFASERHAEAAAAILNRRRWPF